jgi:hypothetical protein
MIACNVTPRLIGTNVSEVPTVTIFNEESYFGNIELQPVMFSLYVDEIRFRSDISRCV